MVTKRIDNLKDTSPPKGTSRNPKGSNAKQRSRKLARETALADPSLVSPADLIRQMLVTTMGGPEIARLAEDLSGNDYKTAFARAWTIAVSQGDLKAIMIFIEQLCPKPKAQVSLVGQDGGPIELSVSRKAMTTDEKIARIKELAKHREAGLND